MTDLYRRLDEPTRRALLGRAARAFLGVTVAPLALPAARAAAPAGGGTAKAVISVFLTGGMSHLDTFDPKPDNPEVQGPVASAATRVPGVRFTEYLPRLADRADKLAVVRTLTHTMGNHEPGVYVMRTGFPQERGALVHPSLGAWVNRLAGKPAGDLPGYVRVGGLGGHPANGFFEVKDAPFPVADPALGVSNGKPAGPAAGRLDRNLALAAALDRDFRGRYDTRTVRAYTDMYADAVRLLRSKDLEAFDTGREPAKVREAYGKTGFGQGCLLARRLVERGSRFVEVDLGGWDSHNDNHKQVRDACGPLDEVLGVLLDDLGSRGLLATTLVVVATEFGRSPEIDQYAGRNHHPLAFACLLAGGGVRGGQAYGRTDKDGSRVADAPVGVLDFNATVAHALGLPLGEVHAPPGVGQQFTVAGKVTGQKGRPLAVLF